MLAEERGDAADHPGEGAGLSGEQQLVGVDVEDHDQQLVQRLRVLCARPARLHCEGHAPAGGDNDRLRLFSMNDSSLLHS